MNRQNLGELPPPPGVMGSLKAGFEAVSSHIWLILVPLLLDMILWFGPRFSIGKLVSPFFDILFRQARTMLTSSADLQRFSDNLAVFNEVIERYNLLSLLSKL